MEQQANYIRRIEIHGLWERFNIGWDLRPDVNILSGINGVGKTTILNRSVGYLEELSGEMKSEEERCSSFLRQSSGDLYPIRCDPELRPSSDYG